MADRPKQQAAQAAKAPVPQAAPRGQAPQKSAQAAQSRDAFNGYVKDLQPQAPMGPPPPPGPEAQAATPDVATAQQSAKTHTENLAVSVGGNLPASRVLVDGDNRVSTGKATHFEVSVARHGLDARFAPGLEIRPGDWTTRWATGGIELSGLSYSFATGKASVVMDTGVAGEILEWFYDVQGDVEQAFSERFRSILPGRLQKPGYDPYSDQELPALLQEIVKSMGAFSGAGTPPKGQPDLLKEVTNPELSAWAQLKPMETTLGESYKLAVKGHASLSVKAQLQGNARTALKDPKLARLTLTANDIELEHKSAGHLSQVRIRSAVFGPGLSLESLDYDLGLEDGASLIKLLALAAELHTGRDMGVHDTNAVKLEGIRKEINAQAREKLPTMLRDQSKAHDKLIPGYSLARMVGLPAGQKPAAGT